jgi:hypothetical protein
MPSQTDLASFFTAAQRVIYAEFIATVPGDIVAQSTDEGRSLDYPLVEQGLDIFNSRGMHCILFIKLINR